jgi:hypothetical protein
MKEPEVGAWVKDHGAVICHVMRPAYIGKKVAFDCSTQSMRIFKVGVLEAYIPYENTFRSIIYTGKKQRTLLTHFPGREIYEPLPWDAYPERAALLKQKEFQPEQMSLW